ncbi:UNVERIFIED_CONTAM: hypothetical protein FKN15_024806 [Acipenser sinensis]
MKYNGNIYNHLVCDNEKALTNLEKAVEITQKDHGDEFEKLFVVTYGNFAWLYYHMGELTKAEIPGEAGRHLQEVPHSLLLVFPLPAVYGGKGWSYLKFLQIHYKRAKECFEKALEEEPDETEWNTGYTIALYRLGSFEGEENAENSAALKQLRHMLLLEQKKCNYNINPGITAAES